MQISPDSIKTKQKACELKKYYSDMIARLRKQVYEGKLSEKSIKQFKELIQLYSDQITQIENIGKCNVELKKKLKQKNNKINQLEKQQIQEQKQQISKDRKIILLLKEKAIKDAELEYLKEEIRKKKAQKIKRETELEDQLIEINIKLQNIENNNQENQEIIKKLKIQLSKNDQRFKNLQEQIIHLKRRSSEQFNQHSFESRPIQKIHQEKYKENFSDISIISGLYHSDQLQDQQDPYYIIFPRCQLEENGLISIQILNNNEENIEDVDNLTQTFN